MLIPFAQAAAAPSMLEQMFPLLIGFGLLWFLLIRPQSQQRKAHDSLVASLQRDDRVVLSNGLHGKVVEVHPDTVVVEAGAKTRLTFDKTSVARRVDAPGTEAAK